MNRIKKTFPLQPYLLKVRSSIGELQAIKCPFCGRVNPHPSDLDTLLEVACENPTCGIFFDVSRKTLITWVPTNQLDFEVIEDDLEVDTRPLWHIDIWLIGSNLFLWLVLWGVSLEARQLLGYDGESTMNTFLSFCLAAWFSILQSIVVIVMVRMNEKTLDRR